MPAHVDLHNHLRKLRRERPLHLTLLDPGKSDTATIGRLAHGAAQAGTDAIMVGGSTGLSLQGPRKQTAPSFLARTMAALALMLQIP